MKMALLLILPLGLLLGCKDAGQLALLTDNSDTSKQVINQQIAIALNASNVLLAPDAFQQVSEVVIQRGEHRSISGMKLDGRSMEAPDKFQLRKRGRHCGLVHINTGKVYPLKGIACRETSDSET